MALPSKSIEDCLQIAWTHYYMAWGHEDELQKNFQIFLSIESTSFHEKSQVDYVRAIHRAALSKVIPLSLSPESLADFSDLVIWEVNFIKVGTEIVVLFGGVFHIALPAVVLVDLVIFVTVTVVQCSFVVELFLSKKKNKLGCCSTNWFKNIISIQHLRLTQRHWYNAR